MGEKKWTRKTCHSFGDGNSAVQGRMGWLSKCPIERKLGHAFNELLVFQEDERIFGDKSTALKAVPDSTGMPERRQAILVAEMF